ncbi:hypothetical protein ABBQ32_003766 [Trebouxia sp. C0010 RCD-2024]
MNSDASTSSQLSPSFSHIGLGRQHGKASQASSPLATPRVFQAEKQLFATPADTVLNHFRVVRQQDQALQSQRHDALQRLSDHHASVAARQHIASGRADSQMALLMQRNGRKLPPNLMKDATLLMDRARCGRPPSRAGQNTGQSSQLSLATNSASGHAGKVPPQQWAPEPCSIACTSFRQSLPPHSSEHAVHVTRKVYTPTTPQGASQSSLSRRTAYGEVLRRVRSAHGPPSQATADRKAGDALGPWPQ